MDLNKRLLLASHRGLDLPFVLPAVAFLLVAALWYVLVTRLTEENAIRVEAAVSVADKLVRAYEEHTARTIREIDQIAKLVKFEYQHHDADVDLQHVIDHALVQTDAVIMVTIANSKGDLVAGSQATGRVNIADRDHFKVHVNQDEDKLFIGKPLLGRVSNRWTVHMSRRLNNKDGSFAGVVVVSMDPSYFTNFYNRMDLGENGLLSVLGQDGVFRARRTGGRTEMGATVDRQEVFRRLQAAQTGPALTASPVDNVPRLVGYRVLRDYPIVVSAGIAEHALLSEYQLARNRYFAAALVGSLLIIAFFLLIGSLVRRLRAEQQQARAAQEIYQGAAEGSLDTFYIVRCQRDAEGRINDFVLVDLNERGARRLGKTKQSLIGAKMTELLSASRSNGFFDKCVKVAESRQPLEEDFQTTSPELNAMWVHHQIVPVGDGVVITSRDITERKVAEEEIRSNRAFLQTIIDYVPIAIYAKSTRKVTFGQFVLWNKASEVTFGVSAEQVLGKTVHDLFPQPTANRAAAQDEAMIANPMVENIAEEPFVAYNRPLRFIHTIKAPIFDDGNNVEYLLGISEDITDRKLASENLKLASTVFDHAAESILVSDSRDRIILTNPAFHALTGFQGVDVLGHEATRFEASVEDGPSRVDVAGQIMERGFWSGESRLRRKDGVVLPCWLNISCVRDSGGQAVNYVRIVNDISSIKESQQRLEQLANYDTLTSLPNRHFFQDRLTIALEHSKRAGCKLALLFIDLDNFKNINDSIGHQVGDLLLKEVSLRLHQCIRSEDTVCRLGGDEFTVIIEDLAGPDEAAVVSERIINALGQPFQLGGHTISTSASIGISVSPGDGNDTSTLIKNADLAMYKAKELGKSGYHFFSHQLGDKVAKRLLLEQSLRGAIERNELFLVYQPKVHLAARGVAGFEALLRWRHDERGVVSPLDFIPVAESTGLIVPIGEWVIDRACAQVKSWKEEGLGELSVAVNVSAQQFKRGDLVGAVELSLAEHGVAAHRLELEITESVVMEDPEAAQRTLKQLKELGVLISVDDFGTGYSSLASLKRYAVDTLKIDRSFTRDVATDAETAAITKAIINMAHSLRMEVVAEGVELPAQLQFLEQNCCDQAQGYLFSGPVPADEVPGLLASLARSSPTKPDEANTLVA